jgi:hypothetical protein
VGPSLFGSGGADRFGLAHLRPAELQPLPSFQGEDLDSESSGGDLCVQACADDPQVAFHAIHVLSRIASSAAALRYTQQGFGRTSSTSRSQGTPRNQDGTDDIRARPGVREIGTPLVLLRSLQTLVSLVLVQFSRMRPPGLEPVSAAPKAADSVASRSNSRAHDETQRPRARDAPTDRSRGIPRRGRYHETRTIK